MVMWVRAMDLYARVYRTVEPKKKRYSIRICQCMSLSEILLNVATYFVNGVLFST